MTATMEPERTGRTEGREGEPCITELAEVAELYAAQSVRVRRLVHLRVTAPDALVEDACQVAWLRLVTHRARVRRAAADQWLVSVAVNEARRLIVRAARDLALATIEEEQDPQFSRHSPDLFEQLVDPRARLEEISTLSERQQRLVWLHGLGFSYDEMAAVTGDSRRTVERQVLRAKRTLAKMHE